MGELVCLDGDVGDEDSIQAFRNELRSQVVRVYSVVAFDALKTRERSDVVHNSLSPEDIGRYIVAIYNGTSSRQNEPIHTLHSQKDIAFLKS